MLKRYLSLFICDLLIILYALDAQAKEKPFGFIPGGNKCLYKAAIKECKSKAHNGVDFEVPTFKEVMGNYNYNIPCLFWTSKSEVKTNKRFKTYVLLGLKKVDINKQNIYKRAAKMKCRW